jgi:hypothetical protein
MVMVSWTAPVVTATSSTTPLAPSTAVWLLVGGLAAASTVVGGQGGIRVAGAHQARRARGPQRAPAPGCALVARSVAARLVTVRGRYRFDVTPRDRVPANIGPDQRAVDVDNLALGDAGRHAARHRALKDAPEAVRAPALPDAGQRGVIRQRLVQAVADGPADRQVHLGFTQQVTIMDDPEQQPGEHQPHRDLGVDPRAAVVGAITIGDSPGNHARSSTRSTLTRT